MCQKTKSIGISSITVPQDLLIETFGLDYILSEVDALMTAKGYGLYIFLTSHADENEKYHKEVLLYGNPQHIDLEAARFKDLVLHFSLNTSYNMRDMNTIKTKEGSFIFTWKVKSAAQGRKDCEKLLVNFYKE